MKLEEKKEGGGGLGGGRTEFKRGIRRRRRIRGEGELKSGTRRRSGRGRSEGEEEGEGLRSGRTEFKRGTRGRTEDE